ncbi:MAG TPA: glutamine synthetase family protein [Stellaceae bacterium]|nr:glutamine synthetase family protein [Stellaceae bacterium]
MTSFVIRHDLWSPEQHAAAERLEAIAAERGVEVVRFAFADAHGVLRGKTLVRDEALRVLRDGVNVTTTMLLKDLAGKTAFPVYTPGGGFDMPELQGAADMVLVPDPTTFRILPWAPHTGWVLCDIHFQSGMPMPFSTRHVLRRSLDRLAERGLDFVAGLEVECHIFRLDDTTPPAHGDGTPPGEPPRTSPLNAGYQYLTELRYDEIDPLMEALRTNLQALDLPLRSLEIEFGPSQVELTFGPTVGLRPADLMMLFRSAVKQVCRRQGYHATFMCRPKLPHVVSSGWHLHQSLRRLGDGTNVFMSDQPGEPFSETARFYLGGLLAHARAATAFSTPTINGYKRYRPYSNAPDRVSWARDNRGVMVRVLGGPGDPATRLENRAGEPAANPYLYMASQVVSGLDGIDRKIEPGPSADTPYESAAATLPRSLMEALAALRDDACFKEQFGGFFIDYFIRLKEAEIARFLSEVTDWEHREYFALL